jgi:Undecaprenyl-phosphate galactose phosphotransferase WbaP
MPEDFQAANTRGLISAEVTYSFPETGVHVSSRPRRSNRIPSQLFRYRVMKRSLDIAAVVAAAPLLIPIFLVVACVVVLSSPGPVFYSHRRIRQNGAFFSMWKFRTMCVNSAEVLEEYLTRHPEARAEWNKTHKLRHDPRVTRVGRFLRQYSVDELPQVWNVLTGKMSLVGPRPIVAAEVEKYRDSFSFYCRVKPGLTGLWQVSGRSTLSYDQRVALDSEYVERWSLSRDLKILLKTIPSVVNQDGAY